MSSNLTKAVLKLLSDKALEFLSQNKKPIGVSLLGVLLWYRTKKNLLKEFQRTLGRGHLKTPRKEGAIDMIFLKRLVEVLRTGMPSIWCRESLYALLLAMTLFLRTYMTIYINDIIGTFVHHLTSRDAKGCSNVIFKFMLVGIPVSVLNAFLKYFTMALSNFVRDKITRECHRLYMSNMNYYKVNNIGASKLDATDQLISEDIAKFSNTLCDVYSNMLKPVLDFILFSIQLARWLQLRGPLSMYLWFSFASWICSLVVPPFGRIAIQFQELEGEFRGLHSRLISNSEMIAFNGGEIPEKKLIDASYDKIKAHSTFARWRELSYNILSGYLNKYSATTVGLTIVTLPILFSEQNYANYKPADIASYYVETTGILQGQAEAVLRLFELQKTIGKLGGLTLRVWNLIKALKEPQIPDLPKEADNPPDLQVSDILEFRNVSIRAPNAELLIHHLNLLVSPGSRLIIIGENGVGKSSLFRVLRGLWPMSAGTIYSPPVNSLHSFYFLSQANFVPVGTLREIIIYPHTTKDMQRENKTDDDLWDALKWSNLADLVINDTRPSLNDTFDWEIHLSPGQKQRMAFARLLYHRPKYAILDDCTNGVAPDVEISLYNKCRELEITVLTISHKNELKRLHEYELKLIKDDDNPGHWVLTKLQPDTLSHFSE